MSISPRLRELVHQSVAILGEVLERELGPTAFRRIEKIRSQMAELRGVSETKTRQQLHRSLAEFRGLSAKERLDIARAFTLMLELMNACENAYRSIAIRQRVPQNFDSPPDSILYVLTAHPTEARSPENIWVFHNILGQLVHILEKPEIFFSESEKMALFHELAVAWRLPVVRGRKPRVRNEAEHIYSTLLRDETLRSLLAVGRDLAPVYIRSWVGGDKDGHPGVDEKAFLESLRLSRVGLVEFLMRRFDEAKLSLQTLRDDKALLRIKEIETHLRKLKHLKAGDGTQITKLRRLSKAFIKSYEDSYGSLHSALIDVKSVLHVFPALVVPLEFRESSDVLLSSPTGKGLAIFRMLQALRNISRGGHPRWYVRGFIVSMASTLEHLQVAGSMVSRALGDIRLPIIPLFEQFAALEHSPEVVRALLKDSTLSKALRDQWDNKLEVMLGYSDSSKESGVLLSRLEIAKTMHKLDRLCRSKGVTPIFFQGSGGSIARGGGSIPEQTAWWSESALRNYKVTIQGEMVERSLANPEITRGQLERIYHSGSRWKAMRNQTFEQIPALDAFAHKVAENYKNKISDPEFLKIVEFATPYLFLDLIKFGSRPNKRSKKLSVSGLRAIPWILCWTQTRNLLPNWWGVGQAWNDTSPKDRRILLAAAKKHPLLSTYVKVLGLILAKIEPEIFRLYLESSGLPEELIEKTWRDFQKEFKLALRFATQALGARNLLPSKPYLAESIHLRSPMIHPLNLLQIIGMQNSEPDLLRLSVAGISSGMMATG